VISPVISLQHIQKNFGSLNVLNDVNLEVQNDEFLTLLGPSGCGKSTLLRILARLEQPTNGEWLGSQKDLNISFVFQDSELLPWRTVEENVTLPLELKQKTLSNENLEEILSLVKLGSFRKYYPHQLSGGMKMRVSLARALVTNPNLLLMDEPFAALDENTRFELQDQILSLRKNKKTTIVFVTHSISEAIYLSDRVVLMAPAGGRIVLDQNIRFETARDFRLRTNSKYNFYVSLFSEKLYQVSHSPSPENR